MIKLSWNEVRLRIQRKLENDGFPKEAKFVYGVPRGGIPVAILFAELSGLKLIESLTEYANWEVIVVDDIIDTGKTRERYKDYYFLPVWDKAIDGGTWVEFPWERMSNEMPAEDSVIRILERIGEDPKREGLIETPKRVVKSWDFLYSGYKIDPKDIMKVFDSEGYDEIVLLKDIEIYSMCEHHMLPFIGQAHVAYIPDKKVIGVSKLARVVEVFARRLQIQERLCQQITHFLMEQLKPKGAACIIEAQHLCMQMRGVQKQNSVMVTSSLEGVFLDEGKARAELMGLIK